PNGGHWPLAAQTQVPEDVLQMQPTVPCPEPREHVQLDGGPTQGSPQLGGGAGHAGGGTACEHARCPVASQAQVHEPAPQRLLHGAAPCLHATPSRQGCGHAKKSLTKQTPIPS